MRQLERFSLPGFSLCFTCGIVSNEARLKTDWGQGAFFGMGTNGVGFDGLGKASNGLWEAGHKPFVISHVIS